MPRLRFHIVLFFCLFTQLAQANIHYAPYGELLADQQTTGYDERYKFIGKERDGETDSKANKCLHLQFAAAEVGYVSVANVETDSKANKCLHLQFAAAEVGYMSVANVETNYDNFGARFLASLFGIWISPDPLVDKYIYVSPYIYCNGNPIKYVDPNGQEKYIFLKHIYGDSRRPAAEKYRDNIPTIHVWAHGNRQTIEFYDEATGETTKANSVKEVLDFLNRHIFPHSEAWQKHLSEGSQAAIVLHSCETGKGDNSIAQQLSEQLPNTVVIAPNEEVAVDKATNEELGSYKTKMAKNSKGEEVLTTNGVGAWTIFREGKPVVSFDGSSKPNVSKPESFHIEGY